MPSVSCAPSDLVIGLIHATPVAIEPMVRAFAARAPGTKLVHYLNENLLALANSEGLSSQAIGELELLVKQAVDSGVQAILLTCSAYSPAVPVLQTRYPMPLLSADDAMLRSALNVGSRIGIVATVEAAGPTSARLLQTIAAEKSQFLELEVRLATGAFAALKAGNGDLHDELVRAQISALLPHRDVVVLAQISMARALAGITPYSKPVLSSPDTSVQAILRRCSQAALLRP